MEYYWSLDIESGKFDFWEETDEVSFLKKVKKFYDDKKYDYGSTIEETYKRHKNGNNHAKLSEKVSN